MDFVGAERETCGPDVHEDFEEMEMDYFGHQ